MFHAVDGSEIAANQLRLAVYLIIYKVLYIPHGAGILNHQQFAGHVGPVMPISSGCGEP